MLFKNTKWQKGKQLTIYKYGGTVEFGTVKKQIQTTVNACFELGTSALRVLCSHSAALSLLAN